ncbi:DUF58 domain-containing protein [Paraburkholderia caballeronis]|uniref:DUF58 domain-containing protein n=1 Tax=Paraburkholderia caballeronis TaxID=416943 RepID=A0A1H7LQ19_9BURK|nr:DUF58 domain-containing protein [Paraburkholderia caballeronis]PXW28554.1 uncharacterized protein DUF58 [Paraburkholderia caballeronis]PXX03920.1 uncharacterized protein DUF58 [Paraburkholderia caballeronis]RAK04664.1 uncharacterized protein DUF58 [Paraburkholderia caballeronis]TDV19565.1 uncharacterized protein DUF58 [Paraburkholderia caballeronis]TDV22165.1 uncharacterized protein DUF58 [Paraburkholderia caballeronis]
MDVLREFHYRLPGRAGGFRPGSHPGTSFGVGQAFALHARLFDHPDPRRVDLRASLRSVPREWLVRLNLQRVAVPVHLLIDVSASMHFGSRRTKLASAAEFAAALGYSAFRAGDRVGMLAFDDAPRDDLYLPARYGRATGDAMAAALLRCEPPQREPGSGIDGLARTFGRIAGEAGLVFVVSDFHWPLDGLPAALDLLVNACVVPMVVWDDAEVEPPASGALLRVHDAETGAPRTLWLRERTRASWRERVAQRRATLVRAFGQRGIRPFWMNGGFDADRLTQYFEEIAA